MISQKDCSDISNHFEVSHANTFGNDLFIDDSVIKTNRLFNSTEILTDFVVKVKSCYVMHIWQPPKVSDLSIYI